MAQSGDGCPPKRPEEERQRPRTGFFGSPRRETPVRARRSNARRTVKLLTWPSIRPAITTRSKSGMAPGPFVAAVICLLNHANPRGGGMASRKPTPRLIGGCAAGSPVRPLAAAGVKSRPVLNAAAAVLGCHLRFRNGSVLRLLAARVVASGDARSGCGTCRFCQFCKYVSQLRQVP
jgi:hypothetical protein